MLSFEFCELIRGLKFVLLVSLLLGCSCRFAVKEQTFGIGLLSLEEESVREETCLFVFPGLEEVAEKT